MQHLRNKLREALRIGLLSISISNAFLVLSVVVTTIFIFVVGGLAPSQVQAETPTETAAGAGATLDMRPAEPKQVYGTIVEEVITGVDETINRYYEVYLVELETGKTVETSRTYFVDDTDQTFNTGDQVVVYERNTSDGITYEISDFRRTTPLLVLIGLFVLITLAITGKKGVRALVGLVFSFTIILGVILPQLLAGNNPVLTVALSALIIVPINFYLAHGFSYKTSIAIAGTLSTLLFSSVLAQFFVDFANLTGYASEEAYSLEQARSELDIAAILLASLIIGFVGILDDITISQAAVAYQLQSVANKPLKFREIYQRSMDIGKDHIASLVNTLILVYTGAALPLLLLVSASAASLVDFLNSELLAEEIVRTLVASIGLILAVPITTALAAYFFSRNPDLVGKDEHHHHDHGGHVHIH